MSTADLPATQITGSQLWHGARAWLKANLPRALLMGGLSFLFGWVLNTYVIAVRYEGTGVAPGGVGTTSNNVLTGGLFWGVLFTIGFALFAYGRRVGFSQLMTEIFSLPSVIGQVYRTQASAALALTLWGVAISLVISAIIGPAAAGITSLGLLLMAGSPVSGIVGNALRHLAVRLITTFAPTKNVSLPGLAGSVATVLGMAAGMFIGWQASDTNVKIILAIVAAGLAFWLLVNPQSPATGAAAILVGLMGYWIIRELFGHVAFADDGGWTECFDCSIIDWVQSEGASDVIAQSSIGGVASGAGSAIGSAIGNTVASVPTGPGGGGGGPGGGGGGTGTATMEPGPAGPGQTPPAQPSAPAEPPPGPAEPPPGPAEPPPGPAEPPATQAPPGQPPQEQPPPGPGEPPAGPAEPPTTAEPEPAATGGPSAGGGGEGAGAGATGPAPPETEPPPTEPGEVEPTQPTTEGGEALPPSVPPDRTREEEPPPTEETTEPPTEPTEPTEPPPGPAQPPTEEAPPPPPAEPTQPPPTESPAEPPPPPAEPPPTPAEPPPPATEATEPPEPEEAPGPDETSEPPPGEPSTNVWGRDASGWVNSVATRLGEARETLEGWIGDLFGEEEAGQITETLQTERIGENIDTVIEVTDTYNHFHDMAGETIDDLDRLGVDENGQNAVTWLRVVTEGAGRATQTFVDGIVQPVMEVVVSPFGGDAEEVTHTLLPVQETAEEASRAIHTAARNIRGGDNYAGQIAENRDLDLESLWRFP